MTSAEATPRRRANPWYVEAFLAVGGWIAGLLAAAAIFALAAALFGGFDRVEGPVALATAIGGAFIAVGALIGARAGGDFLRHLAIALTAAGLTASVAGVWYLTASWMPQFRGAQAGEYTPLRIGISGLVACVFLAAVGGWSARRMSDAILTFLTTSAGFWILTISLAAIAADIPAIAGATAAAPAALTLVGLALVTRDVAGRRRSAAGAALLISAMLHYGTQTGLGFIGVSPAAPGLASLSLFAIGAVYCLSLLRDRYPLGGLLAATAALSAGLYLLPDAGGVAILIALGGVAAGHRGLAAVGCVALAWFISRYYYDLSASLLEKSAILAGLGATTLAGAFILNRRAKSAREKRKAADAPTPGMRADRRIAASALFGLVLAASLGLVNRSAIGLERDFAGARTILLPLGPVDPRSLIQGDYMTLRFDQGLFPAVEAIGGLPARGSVFLKIDAEGVAAFSRLVEGGAEPAEGEIRVQYRIVGGAMQYCPASFFFQEGEADLFAPARFAVVLVTADGRTRLTALADADRNVIDPHADKNKLKANRARP